MQKRLTDILANILRLITDRFVLRDRKIPQNVLALKDEACAIVGKAVTESDPEVLARYEQRLTDIRAALSKGNTAQGLSSDYVSKFFVRLPKIDE